MANAQIYAWQTQYTRQVFKGVADPQISLHNRKPFRTQEQKALAKRTCRRAEDGSYYSAAPVSFHQAPRGSYSEGR